VPVGGLPALFDSETSYLDLFTVAGACGREGGRGGVEREEERKRVGERKREGKDWGWSRGRERGRRGVGERETARKGGGGALRMFLHPNHSPLHLEPRNPETRLRHTEPAIFTENSTYNFLTRN
jgi:hypothetical protein